MKQLSSDVGGTFVDLVLWDSANDIFTVDKLPSTRHTADGIINAITKLGQKTQFEAADIDRFVHGFTIATNAWLERRGANVLLLTTRGFKDILEIGTQRRSSLYDLRQASASPIVKRSMVFEVDERIDSFGEVVTELTRSEIDRIVTLVCEQQPESVAIALLFSHLNPAHEELLRTAIMAAVPGIEVYPSYRIDPQIEEYQRTFTTATTAYVGPAVRDYIHSLQAGLRHLEMETLMLMRSDGGIATPEATLENPGTMLLSGPAGGVIAAESLGNTIGIKNIVTFDMGGTSADFSLIVDGLAARSNERIFGNETIRLPMIDIETIAAGGGSIAQVDHAGALTVGPHSAGAQPGPACYGRGGSLPTLTDAILVLGMIDPDDFAGGNVKLDVDAARSAIRQHVADPLGLSIEDAAIGMIDISNAQMRQAIRALTIERGHDIRHFSLTAFGGAGSIFAALMQPELEIAEILIPPRPGVFAALGLLMSDVRHNVQASFSHQLKGLNTKKIAAALSELGGKLEASLDRDGIAQENQEISFALDMRYIGQFHNLTIPLSGAIDVKYLADAFHKAHKRVYGHASEENAIEIVNLRAAGCGRVQKAGFARIASEGRRHPAPDGVRKVRFPGTAESVDCPVWGRADLTAGQTIQGPAIITQSDTTILVLPGQVAMSDDWGVLHISGKE